MSNRLFGNKSKKKRGVIFQWSCCVPALRPKHRNARANTIEFRDLAPEERHGKRLLYGKPVSDEFFDWAGSLNALPKSLLGEAVHYSLSQRQYLENIYLDGRLELSNNISKSSSPGNPQDSPKAA